MDIRRPDRQLVPLKVPAFQEDAVDCLSMINSLSISRCAPDPVDPFHAEILYQCSL